MKHKYISPSKLSIFLDNLKNIFAALKHTHILSEITDYVVDSELSSTSTNPVQNHVLDAEFEMINNKLADLMYEEITFTSFTNNVGTVELGSTVDSVTLSWETNKTPTTLTLDGASIDVNAKSHIYSGLALKPTSVTTKTYTITATDDRNTEATKTTSFSFVNGVYYGAINSGTTINNTVILGLSHKLQNSKSTSFTTTADDGQYIVYALPSRLGTPAFNVGGFDGGFHLETSLSFTNTSGYTETYNVYFSDNLSLGKTTVKVS